MIFAAYYRHLTFFIISMKGYRETLMENHDGKLIVEKEHSIYFNIFHV